MRHLRICGADRALQPGWLGSGLLCFCLVAAGCGPSGSGPDPNPPRQHDPVAQMRAAVRRGDWPLARQYAPQALITQPGDAQLMFEAAQVAAMNDHKREAAKLLAEAVALTDYQPAARVDFAVQALIDVGEVYHAIDLLEQSLRRNPNNIRQRRDLVAFLGEVQRTELLAPHLQALIQARQFDVNLLEAVTEVSSRRFSHNTDDILLRRNPDDHRVRLGEAHEMVSRRDDAAASVILEDILQHHPDFAPAHAMYGQVLVGQRRLDAIPEWIDNAPAESRKYADYWLTLGDVALESNETDAAVRAYWEATRCDWNNSTAWTRLAQSIRRLQREGVKIVTPEQLASIDQRIADLLELRKRYYDFVADGKTSQRYATRVAEMLMKLGRNWEGEAWTAIATTLQFDRSEELPALRESILARLEKDASWISSEGTPAMAIDLSQLPLFSFSSSSPPETRNRLVPKIASTDHLRLSEESSRWGLTSIGADNNPDDPRLGPLIRSTGVGGGALDYDLDGLPDIIVMNAGGRMLQQDSKPNELMRHLGERFVDVTAAAGVMDTGFGQGVAIGDWNEDGFADLFIANLGANRLLRNNGDGTFADCSDRLQDGNLREWSTSSVFVDLNGDGIADLLTTNYCAAAPDMDKPCPDDDGVLGPCHPLRFAAHPDQFLAGTDRGRLIDMSSRWIPNTSPARGLGMVAGLLDGQHLGVFIANDMSANHFYSYAGDDQRELVESAVARGLAVDGRTSEQASMGIASCDFDGDGDLDFYVTGFAREYNIFYRQVAPGLWNDETAQLGLVEPTHMTVGFGTEAIDLDNDGIEEIAVTNGHIGDFDDPEVPPYAQPFQLFRRDATGRFALVDDDAWGQYTATPHVGRALWTIDVNRDGRNDLMITHMSEQLCLLVNRTQSDHHHIGFRLVGTRCSRDAVGAIVRFQAGGRQRTLWQLAGDGYMCSNERVLRAGLDSAERVEDVTVTWQDGSVEQLGTLEADNEYLIVQGEGQAFRLD